MATFTGTEVTQNEVTFHFDTTETWGFFANGVDIWVVGPVTITAIDPAFDNTGGVATNGWEVNPNYGSAQAWTNAGISKGYDASLMPALPYTSSTSETIVKVVSGASSEHSTIRRAIALTVVPSIPAGDGDDVFRPPYIGSAKPQYAVADLRTDLLPTLTSVGSPPTLESIVTDNTKGIWLRHHTNQSRATTPYLATDPYQPSNIVPWNNTMLRLMLDDTILAKTPALIAWTQHCIDRAHVMLAGYRVSGSGHDPNHRTAAAWAAVMLDLTDVATMLQDPATITHENQYLVVGSQSGIPMWGEPNSELKYWTYAMRDEGSRSIEDPYGYIDGGRQSSVGASYQNITSQSYKQQVLIAELFPELRLAGWSTAWWPVIREYAERWVTHGTWTLPDPVKKPTVGFYDGTKKDMSGYGTDFGPDGAGGFIAGDGRWPEHHGSNTDGGQNKSTFAVDVWNAYWEAGASDTTPPTVQGASIPSAGTTIVLSMSESVVEGAGGDGGFAITASGGAVTATVVASGTSITLTTSRTIDQGETVTLDYTQPGNGIEDGAGNDLASFSSLQVFNGSTQGGPPTVPSLDYTGWEAEAMLVESPAASDAATYTPATVVTQATTVSSPGSGGRLRCKVTPPAGTYKLVVVAAAPEFTSDTFWIGELDAEPTGDGDICDLAPIVGLGLQSFDVTTRGTGSWNNPEFNPKTWVFDGAEHEITIRIREADTALDSFSFVDVSADVTAPTPNPPTIQSAEILGTSELIVVTNVVSDPSGPVEYRLRVDGGTPTAWQTDPEFSVQLASSDPVTVEVQARDAVPNEGNWANPVVATTEKTQRLRITGNVTTPILLIG